MTTSRRLIVDDRAGSKELWKYPCIREHGELARLSSADVAFVGNGPKGNLSIGIEVKTIGDLLGSIYTGRLQASQIPEMVEMFDVQYLLHYGGYRPNPETSAIQLLRNKRWEDFVIGKKGAHYSYLQGMLATIGALGVRVVRVADEEEAAVWVAGIYKWWQKPWAEHKGLHTFDKSHNLGLLPSLDKWTKLRAQIAVQFAGIGDDRAVTVARHFKSIAQMLTATEKEWASIPGIGKVIAKSVILSLHSETEPVGQQKGETVWTRPEKRTEMAGGATRKVVKKPKHKPVPQEGAISLHPKMMSKWGPRRKKK